MAMQKNGGKKKLLLISPMLHQGGFEKVCVETARLLQPFYEVHILIFDDRDRFFDTEGLDVTCIGVPAKDGKLNKALNVIRRCMKVRRFKKEQKTDISYSFGSTANIVNCLTRCGDRIVAGIHGGIDLDNSTHMKLFFKKADAVLCCSRGILALAGQRYGRISPVAENLHKGVYVFNPIDTDRIRELAAEPVTDIPFMDSAAGGTDTEARVLVTVGRDDPQKGYWHMIKAFYLLQKDPGGRELRLLIIGGGSFEKGKRLCKDLGIADKVCFAGLRENPYKYMRRSDLYLLSSNHEGFPVAMAEAMAAGLPAVASDARTGPRELLLKEDDYLSLCRQDPLYEKDHEPVKGQGGILFGPLSEKEDYDPDSIPEEDVRYAGCIRTLLDDDAAMRKTGADACARAQEFGSRAYVQALMKVLEGDGK